MIYFDFRSLLGLRGHFNLEDFEIDCLRVVFRDEFKSAQLVAKRFNSSEEIVLIEESATASSNDDINARPASAFILARRR